ncbi:hypothetical protein [Nocardia brasiliensis]|uniref:Uncharacterized protein n=1 Tax=Nocardia brasiliensis (strain ATCC 700358 / HUJEG-1) TaxID=1133849 RepID=K0F0L8_NOCB7|nr:hypothetical protein [Nocardia brasiliensis]AFU02949.1 hypothetical protein O3I_024990 [Nocardia brasiliensis ATCC 700358]OCF86021.1 hypothetical protein AW168_33205 [Nocardia brasiliensis]
MTQISDARLDDDSPTADDYDPATVAAVGKLTEALEIVEAARGHLYSFHRLTGTADFAVETAATMLREAGHPDFADRLQRDLVGRNVIPGRWTFQVVEEYDDTYYARFRDWEEQARRFTGGQRHLHEAELKRARRTDGQTAHEATPDESASD